MGRHVHVDDLVVADPAGRRWFGTLPLAYVEREAEALGWAEIHQDTGCERHDAHRLYRWRGYEFRCHQASRPAEVADADRQDELKRC